jgi:hypothetical protein
MCYFNKNGKFKFQIDLDRHGPRTLLNDSHLAEPPPFSLYTTFNSLVSHTTKKAETLIISASFRKQWNNKTFSWKKELYFKTSRDIVHLQSAADTPSLDLEVSPFPLSNICTKFKIKVGASWNTSEEFHLYLTTYSM